MKDQFLKLFLFTLLITYYTMNNGRIHSSAELASVDFKSCNSISQCDETYNFSKDNPFSIPSFNKNHLKKPTIMTYQNAQSKLNHQMKNTDQLFSNAIKIREQAYRQFGSENLDKNLPPFSMLSAPLERERFSYQRQAYDRLSELRFGEMDLRWNNWSKNLNNNGVLDLTKVRQSFAEQLEKFPAITGSL